MLDYITNIRLRLLAVLCVYGCSTVLHAAEWTNGPTCGADCAPNVQTYGYTPPQWRRWPGTDLQSGTQSNRPEPFPTPRYELPKPLHEADAGQAPTGPILGAPMGSGVEPSAGLPDSTHPLEGGPKKSMRSGEDMPHPSGTPGLNPFQQIPKSGEMPVPDNSRRQRTPVPDFTRTSAIQKVLLTSAAVAGPSTAQTNCSSGANPLRDDPTVGWQNMENSTTAMRVTESATMGCPAKRPTNPLRDN